MISFATNDLKNIRARPVSAAATHSGIAYAGNTSVTVKGPAGELIELIQN